MDNTTMWLVFGLICGVASLIVGFVYFFQVKKEEAGSARAQKVAGWIHKGAEAYLARLFKALLLLAGGIAIVLFVAYTASEGIGRGVQTAICFLCGSICSAIAAYLGMEIAVRANVRTATASGHSLSKAFNIAFHGGAVMGFAVVGIATIGMCTIYLITKESQLLLAFSFGASSLSLLAKAGGGIYTKTADVAADLVGKVEKSIPEDDPRNPAVVADNVGDNVGDVAGMGADIFDSYVAAVVAAMLLGAGMSASVGGDEMGAYTVLPLLLCALGIVASLIGVAFVKVNSDQDKPGKKLNFGTVLTCIIFSIFVIIAIAISPINKGVIWAIIVGTIVGVIIGETTDFFTSDEYSPVKNTAEYSESGAGITIIAGMSYGMLSIFPSILGIVIAMLVAYYACGGGEMGIYGIGISAVGMLAVSGMIVSADAYGPIVDNARGIAEMSGMDEEVIHRADILDSAGNTAKAITKGFAISAAALTVLALFAAFQGEIQAAGYNLDNAAMSLMDPLVLSGIFLGAMCPPLFSALVMLAVTNNAFKMIETIRQMWKDDPEILKGTEGHEPDYTKCVDMASAGALNSLVVPACIAVAFPLIVGFIMGPKGLAGCLGGAIITGVVFAGFMSNAGGLWDNSKKYVEDGHNGGRGSEAHKAAVIGDTVGDPFKDTAGPSLNTLITVMSLVASTFAPLIAKFSLFGR